MKLEPNYDNTISSIPENDFENTQLLVRRNCYKIMFMLTHWGRNKMAAISNALSCIKMYEFRLTFHWSSFPRVTNQQYPSIGSDDGLAPTRQQAIIWITVGFICSICPSRMYLPVRYDEFVCNRFRDSLVMQEYQAINWRKITSWFTWLTHWGRGTYIFPWTGHHLFGQWFGTKL